MIYFSGMRILSLTATLFILSNFVIAQEASIVDYCLDLEYEYDKFENTDCFESPDYYPIQFHKTVGTTAKYQLTIRYLTDAQDVSEEVILLLESDEKIKKSTSVSVKPYGRGQFKHTATIQLTSSDVTQLKKSGVTDVRIGAVDLEIERTEQFKQYLKCLTESNREDFAEPREKRPIQEGEFVTLADRQPKYPGGDGAVFQYLSKNTPKIVGADGVVYVSYIIDQRGEVRNVKVIRSLNAEADSAAVEVVSSLKGYEAGVLNGFTIPVQIVVPVRFTN